MLSLPLKVTYFYHRSSKIILKSKPIKPTKDSSLFIALIAFLFLMQLLLLGLLYFLALLLVLPPASVLPSLHKQLQMLI